MKKSNLDKGIKNQSRKIKTTSDLNKKQNACITTIFILALVFYFFVKDSSVAVIPVWTMLLIGIYWIINGVINIIIYIGIAIKNG